MYKKGLMSDIFVTWDGATLEFENSNLITESIIILGVHDMQQASRKAESGDHKHVVNDTRNEITKYKINE